MLQLERLATDGHPPRAWSSSAPASLAPIAFQQLCQPKLKQIRMSPIFRRPSLPASAEVHPIRPKTRRAPPRPSTAPPPGAPTPPSIYLPLRTSNLRRAAASASADLHSTLTPTSRVRREPTSTSGNSSASAPAVARRENCTASQTGTVSATSTPPAPVASRVQAFPDRRAPAPVLAARTAGQVSERSAPIQPGTINQAGAAVRYRHVPRRAYITSSWPITGVEPTTSRAGPDAGKPACRPPASDWPARASREPAPLQQT